MAKLRPTTPGNAVKSSIGRPPEPARLWSLCLAALVALALLVTALPSYAARLEPPIQASQAPDVPEATCPAGGQCFADVPSGNSFYEFINRIYMQDLVTGYPCGGLG